MENTKDNTNIWVDISEASKVIGQKEVSLNDVFIASNPNPSPGDEYT